MKTLFTVALGLLLSIPAFCQGEVKIDTGRHYMQEITAPTAPPSAGFATCWTDSSDHHYKCENSSGLIFVAPVPLAEFSAGTCTTAKTIDPANGSKQKVTLTAADACALTFTQPAAGTADVQIKVVQDSASTHNGTISGGLWPGASVPTITATASAVDIIRCYLDGTSAYCSTVGQNFH